MTHFYSYLSDQEFINLIQHKLDTHDIISPLVLAEIVDRFQNLLHSNDTLSDMVESCHPGE